MRVKEKPHIFLSLFLAIKAPLLRLFLKKKLILFILSFRVILHLSSEYICNFSLTYRRCCNVAKTSCSSPCCSWFAPVPGDHGFRAQPFSRGSCKSGQGSGSQEAYPFYEGVTSLSLRIGLLNVVVVLFLCFPTGVVVIGDSFL